MNKLLILIAMVPLFLVGCAQTPDTTTTRHQIDDLADNDRDGVINQRDLCDETPAGVKVDREGCTEWQIKQTPNVISFFFELDKDAEEPRHTEPLGRLLTLLRQNPDANVILLGDTSPEASLTYNRALAKRRTHTIREMLMRNGVDAARIKEQEFTQITSLTQHLHARKRRAIAVVMTEEMTVKPTWNIYSSEQKLNREEANRAQ